MLKIPCYLWEFNHMFNIKHSIVIRCPPYQNEQSCKVKPRTLFGMFLLTFHSDQSILSVLKIFIALEAQFQLLYQIKPEINQILIF